MINIINICNIKPTLFYFTSDMTKIIHTTKFKVNMIILEPPTPAAVPKDFFAANRLTVNSEYEFSVPANKKAFHDLIEDDTKSPERSVADENTNSVSIKSSKSRRKMTSNK